MSSFLWLLLYLAPLLGLTAAVFGWFGWQWRGRDMRQQIKDLEARANPNAIPTEASPTQDTELSALREELKSARTELHRRDDDTAKAREAAQALETETARLLRDLDLLRAERDQANSALAAVQAELTELRNAPAPAATEAPDFQLVAPEAPAKPKRKRTTASKSKNPASGTLHASITALESRLVEQQALGADAGELERLQNQIRLLRQAETKAEALTGVADDDLTQIKGIKKVTNEQLRAHGIRTWRQIAGWSDDDMRAFSELLAFKNRATREKWREQARALHEATHGPLS